MEPFSPHWTLDSVYVICFGQWSNSEQDTSRDLSMPGPPSPVALATLTITGAAQAVVLDAETAKKKNWTPHLPADQGMRERPGRSGELA